MPDTLAQTLKKHRKRVGWSQQKLAEISTLSIGQIQSMEIGRITDPGKVVLVKLADAFGISLDELVGRELSRSRKKPS